MRIAIPHLAPLALAICIGCNAGPVVPAALPGGSASVTAGENPPRPKPAARRTAARPVEPVSPSVMYD